MPSVFQFDEYCTEVRSGRLHWSPVHKSEKFWRENTQRFNEKGFELIKLGFYLLGRFFVQNKIFSINSLNQLKS